MPPVSGAGQSNDITKKTVIPYSHRSKTRDAPAIPDRRKEHPYAAYLAATTAAQEAKAQRLKLRRQWEKTDGIHVTESVEEEKVKKKKKQLISSSSELTQRLKKMQQVYQKKTYHQGTSHVKNTKSPPSDKTPPNKSQAMSEAHRVTRRIKSTQKSPASRNEEASCSLVSSTSASGGSSTYGNTQGTKSKFLAGRAMMKSNRGVYRRAAGRVFRLGSTPPRRASNGTNHQDEGRCFPRVPNTAQRDDSQPKMAGSHTRQRQSKDRLIPLPVNPRNRGTSCEHGMQRQRPQNNQGFERPQTAARPRTITGWTAEMDERLFMYEPDCVARPAEPLANTKPKNRKVSFSNQKLERQDGQASTSGVPRNVSGKSLSQSDGETFNELQIRTLLEEFGADNDDCSSMTSLRSEEECDAHADQINLSQKNRKTSEKQPDGRNSITDLPVPGRVALQNQHSNTKRCYSQKRKMIFAADSPRNDHSDSSLGLDEESSDTETPGFRRRPNKDDYTQRDKHDKHDTIHRKAPRVNHAQDMFPDEAFGFDRNVMAEAFRLRDSCFDDFSLQEHKEKSQNMPQKHGGSNLHSLTSESSSASRVPSTEGGKQSKQKQSLTRDSFWDDEVVDASEEDPSFRIVARAMNPHYYKDDSFFLRTQLHTSGDETVSQGTLSTIYADFDPNGNNLPEQSTSMPVTKDSPVEDEASEEDFDYSECFSTEDEIFAEEPCQYASFQSTSSDDDEPLGIRSHNSSTKRSGKPETYPTEKSKVKSSILENDHGLSHPVHCKESKGQCNTSNLALDISRLTVQESKHKRNEESSKLKSGSSHADDLYDFSGVCEGPASSFDGSKGSTMQNPGPLELKENMKWSKDATPAGGKMKRSSYNALQDPVSENDTWHSKPVQSGEFFISQESSSEPTQPINLEDLNDLFADEDIAKLWVTEKDNRTKTSGQPMKAENGGASSTERLSAGSHTLRDQVDARMQSRTSQSAHGTPLQQSKVTTSRTTEGKKASSNGSITFRGSRYKKLNLPDPSWLSDDLSDDLGLDDLDEVPAKKSPMKGTSLKAKSPLGKSYKPGGQNAASCFKIGSLDWPTSDDSSPEDKCHGSSETAGAEHKTYRESNNGKKSILNWPDSDSDDYCQNGYPLTCRSLGYSPNKSKNQHTPEPRSIGFGREEKETSPKVEMDISRTDLATPDQSSRDPTPSRSLGYCLEEGSVRHTPEPWWRGYNYDRESSSSPDVDMYGMDLISPDKTSQCTTPSGYSMDTFKIQHAQEAWWSGDEDKERELSPDVDLDEFMTQDPELQTPNKSLGNSPINSKTQHSPEPWWTSMDSKGKETSLGDEMVVDLTEQVTSHKTSDGHTPSRPLGYSPDKSKIQHALEGWWQGRKKDQKASTKVETDQCSTELLKLKQSHKTPNGSPKYSPNKSTIQHAQDAWWKRAEAEEKELSPKMEMDTRHTHLVTLDQISKCKTTNGALVCARSCTSSDMSPRQTLQEKHSPKLPNTAQVSPATLKNDAGEKPEGPEASQTDEDAPLSPCSLDESVSIDFESDEEAEEAEEQTSSGQAEICSIYNLQASYSKEHLIKDHMNPQDNPSHEDLHKPEDYTLQSGPMNKWFTDKDESNRLHSDQSDGAEYKHNFADDVRRNTSKIECHPPRLPQLDLQNEDAAKSQMEDLRRDLHLEDVDDDWDSSKMQDARPSRFQQGTLQIENLDDMSLDDVEETETEHLPPTITPRRSQPFLVTSSQQGYSVNACSRPQTRSSLHGTPQPEASTSHPPGSARPPLLNMSQPTHWGVSREANTAWKEKNDHCTYLSDSSCSDAEQCQPRKSSARSSVISISTNGKGDEKSDSSD